jgi:methionyl-tRNA formyltransferase
MTKSPVKEWAEKKHIEIITPTKLLEVRKYLEKYIPENNIQIGVLFAYGKIIPKWLIDLFPFGIINIHPSLLPLYRGPSPIESPIINKDKETAITIINLDVSLDTGDILVQKKYPLGQYTTTEDILHIIRNDAAGIVKNVLDTIESGTQTKKEQDNRLATHTRKWTKEDSYLDFANKDLLNDLYARFRAFGGNIGCWTFIKNKDKIIRVKVISLSKHNDMYQPEVIIPENGKRQTFSEFCRNNSSFEFLPYNTY